MILTVDPPSIGAGVTADVTLWLHNTDPGPCTNIVGRLVVAVGLGLERGRSTIELPRLEADAGHPHRLRLRPPGPGRFIISVPNLSYRNGVGLPCRERGQLVELVVEPAAAGPASAATQRPEHAPPTRRDEPTVPRRPSIFVSYRRSDTGFVVGPFADQLGRYLDMPVFFDVSRLRGGENWLDRIEQEVNECVALVAVIGSTWLIAADERGRRIDAVDDVVRHEIATALARGVPVLPVLVRTSMPASGDLPADIRGLAAYQAVPYEPDEHRKCLRQLARAIRARLAVRAARA